MRISRTAVGIVLIAFNSLADQSGTTDLEAIAGLWQFPKHAVWIHIKVDGSTFQCRIDKNGVPIIARGVFIPPNTVKWDNAWGVETIEYRPGFLTVHSPNRKSFTVVPTQGPMADECIKDHGV